VSPQDHGSDPSVLIIGAGLAGMTAAFHLAEWGAQTYLADRAPHLGGAFLLLDHTFTTDSCGLCLALPRQPSYCPTIASELHPRIATLPCTTLAALEGGPGDFVARLHHAPRYVDPHRCDNCGACATACPVPRPLSRWGRSMAQAQQKAIYPPPPRAVPFVYAIDPDVCTRCGACVTACPRGAIDLQAAPAESRIEIGAVLLSPGFAPFDAARAAEYGWGRCVNVVTSLEFEHMLNRSGPTGGHPLRLSDGQPPRRIAFIHCVGSRSENLGRPYCSTSCCMIVAKQVGLTRKIDPQAQISVFTMDVRTAGKGYERYFQGVQALPGVTYRRGLPAMVHETAKGQGLRLLTPDGEQVFDLVVLAVGMGPSDSVRELASRAGVDLDPYGFVLHGDNGPGSTSRPGVFAAGAALAPADVPEAVTQAAAVASLAAQALPLAPSSSHSPLPQRREEEERVLDQPPRIGLFLCTCRGTLAEKLDFRTLVAEGKGLRAVAHIELLEAACETSGRSAMEQAVAEHDLNRIVVGGCSPRLYADDFEALMHRLGLPSRLLARADIREGAAWAHSGDAATAVARDELAMAVAGLRETPYSPLAVRPEADIAPRVLVLGGGLAGMTAALTLAALGTECDLLEREALLGGNLRESWRTLEGLDARALLSETVARVQRAEGVRVWTEADLMGWSGARGDFVADVRCGDETRRERYGALILATGARQIQPQEYLYGKHPNIVTQRELESLIADRKLADLRSVVMIQCVGSRNDERPYCSRICCAQAIKNALVLRAFDPSIEVSILFRDMRTMGTHELYYQQARSLGVIFVQYDENSKPVVSSSSVPGSGSSQPAIQLQVTVWDNVLEQEIALYPDLVVLSAGIEPRAGNESLAQLTGVPLDEDHFFAEAHPKLRPTDLAQPGVFLCGMAYGPRFIEESIAQARAAALRAALTVARPPEPRRDIATVVQKLCSFCGLCVTHCPYGARVLDEEKRFARVIDHLCQGCGVCVAVCPNGASRQPALEPTQVLAIVDAALAE
jgi:heterodisulfide reductase subunit A